MAAGGALGAHAQQLAAEMSERESYGPSIFSEPAGPGGEAGDVVMEVGLLLGLIAVTLGLSRTSRKSIAAPEPEAGDVVERSPATAPTRLITAARVPAQRRPAAARPPSAPVVSAVATNQRICACHSAGEILPIVSEFGALLNEVNLATALHRIAKHTKRNQADPRTVTATSEWRLLLDLAADRLQEFNVQGISNAFWALATMKVGPQDEPLMFDALRRVTLTTAAQFQPQGLANSAWACATLGWADSAVVSTLAAVSKNHIANFNAQDLANTAWAFAALKHDDIALFSAVAKTAVPYLNSFKTQELSNLVWAFKSRRQHGGVASNDDPTFFDAVGTAAARRVREMPLGALVNIAWSLAAAGQTHEVFFDTVCNSVTERVSVGSQELATLLWASATLRFRHSGLLSVATSTIISQASTFSPQDLASTSWAFATLRYCDRQSMEKLAEAALATQDRLHPPAISNLLWSFATLGVFHAELFTQLGSAVIANAPKFNVADVVASATAISKSGTAVTADAMKALGDAAVSHKDSLTPSAWVAIVTAFLAAKVNHVAVFTAAIAIVRDGERLSMKQLPVWTAARAQVEACLA
eukprot:CAMPEP_0204275540 /NCGR_PEP_ID=MMETSP0468-20130131/26194_1 /ASSEMBLY_ACC=CAM_ASM_000383 /TAXON_ID=2969 /ORGANISM="Oxyrrhis marina" /LENGTH=586 /DNA_ID=CAMNT_0051251905 /DNA_START=214 /DNA_END=1974 /DNA_ORIENTATION=-